MIGGQRRCRRRRPCPKPAFPASSRSPGSVWLRHPARRWQSPARSTVTRFKCSRNLRSSSCCARSRSRPARHLPPKPRHSSRTRRHSGRTSSRKPVSRRNRRPAGAEWAHFSRRLRDSYFAVGICYYMLAGSRWAL